LSNVVQQSAMSFSPPSSLPVSPPNPLPSSTAWLIANQQYLMATIGQIRLLLERAVAQSEETAERVHQPLQEQSPQPVVWPEFVPPSSAPNSHSALAILCRTLKLSPFERSVLLLCLGAELSRTFGLLCAQLYGAGQTACPTFGLALSVLPEAHWQALTPESPLRFWQLIDIAAGTELTNSPLRIDERIAHYLMGVSSVDQRLRGVMTVGSAEQPVLPESHEVIAQQISAIGLAAWPSPVVQLCGSDGATKQMIALAAAGQKDQQLYTIAAETLPTELSQLNVVQGLCEREALLNGAALVLDCDRISASATGDGHFAQLNMSVNRFVESCRQPLLVMSRDRRPQQQRPLLTYDVHSPTTQEQREIWRREIAGKKIELEGGDRSSQDPLSNISTQSAKDTIDRLVDYFNLSSPAIQATCNKVQRLAASTPNAPPISDMLWDTCLSQARPQLGDLAQPIETLATWDDIVLPQKEKQVLQTITAHVRQRSKVYENWGFSGKSRRGLGISALFAGPSGTGKTMAAEIIAKALNLDLYRVDISAMVSKYIGETEKNLRRVFDAAETGGAILLFDEADALFGKRSDVSDSHDRYANMEVAYLLQRIESYRGLAILTTNLKDSVDQAFLRRIRFVVQFPFPDAKQREEIWKCIFPSKTPTHDLHYRRLSKLSVAGGNIRNIALNAAFIAADVGKSVEMKHILLAAQSEYIKLERPLTDAEVRGWVSETKEALS